MYHQSDRGLPDLADRALLCKRDQTKMRDYMDRRVTPPERVTSPTWGPPPAAPVIYRKLTDLFNLSLKSLEFSDD